VQVVPGRVGRAAERGVHVADLVHAQAGQRHAFASRRQPVTAERGRAGSLSAGRGPPLWPGRYHRARRLAAGGGLCRGDREPGQGGQRQGDMPVPGLRLPKNLMLPY
jgi:hypothetical protein